MTGLAGLLRPRMAAWIAVAAVGMLAAVFLWQRPAAAVPPVSREVADFVPDSIKLSQEVLARYDGGIVQRPGGEVVRLTCYDRVNRVILKIGATFARPSSRPTRPKLRRRPSAPWPKRRQRWDPPAAKWRSTRAIGPRGWPPSRVR